MQVTIVHVHVKPEHVEDFKAATKLNHLASVQEAGNLRFDVLQLNEDLNKFVLYEAYASAEDVAAHKDTQHYLTWRDTIADWMAEPRKGISYEGLLS